MKKIDFMFKLLFVVAFANVSFGQVGPYFGGPTCEEAVPITVGDGYISNNFAGDDWYEFTAPCDGDLDLTICPYGDNKQRRIYSGTCDALVLESTASWLTCANPSVTMTAGEVVYIQMDDSWDSDDVIFDVNFSNPACPEPTSLASFATAYNEAIVAWFAGGGESEWTICYGPMGFDPETEGTIVSGIVSTSFSITGLSELTCYDWYVQADCGGGLSSCFKAGPNTFCTPAICPVPVGLNEDAITNVSTDLHWSAGGAEVEWDLTWGAEGFVLGDEPMLDLGIPDYATVGLDPATCYDWYVRAQCEVDLGGGTETVYSLWVGPNEWCTEANCLTPSAGTMIATGGLNATLGWTENNTPAATEWNLQYGAPGFALGTGTTVTNIPTNPYTLGGLTPGTDYCFYVQAVCGEGEDSLSGWGGPYCFTTGIFCDEPLSPTAAATSGTEADLSWTAGGTETAWDVSWGVELDDPDAGTMEDAAVFPALSLTGLTAGVTYCYYVRANCGGEDSDSSSAWVGPTCWTQPALCATPFGVDVINITNTAAHVNFTSIDAESFDIEWGAPCFDVEAGEEIGSEYGTPDAPYYMTGLDPSTPYWVYVRAHCGVDSTSAWTEAFLFGTDITNDDPCDAETLVLDGAPVLRHNFEATTLPGEAAIAPPAGGCFDSDGWCAGDGVDRTVWFQFVAPASGQVVVSTFDTSLCVTNSYTEIAIYSTGDCSVISNFVAEYANTLDENATEPPYGSTVTACDLTPGQTYYVMVNPISYIQTDVHFAISLSSIEEVSAGLGLSPTICAGSDYDLFDAIAGYTTEGGTWYNPTVAPGNELPSYVGFPDSEGSFNMYYVVSNGCDADTVMTVVSTAYGANAGGDGFSTTCNTYDIILSDYITGLHDGGGLWEYDGVDPAVALADGLFAPLGMSAGLYKFNYTVTSEFCPTDTATVFITLYDCLTVGEEEANELVVYPNPVVDILTVQNISVDGSAIIEVLDIEGRVIISDNVSNVFGDYTIDMTNIESGVYFVKLTADDSTRKVRIVKQ